jgi:hypothetical protein
MTAPARNEEFGMVSESTPPRNPRLRITLLAVAAGIVVVAAFLVGESLGQRSMLAVASVELDSIQATLAFNRLLGERRVASLLAKGCVVQAANVIDIARDKDMELLSNYLSEGRLDRSAIKYISDRDPGVLGELTTFKSKYGRAWTEMECNN